MTSLKNEIEVSCGRYKCWISWKWGYVINPPAIIYWSPGSLREYSEFCKALADAIEKWEREH
ncbi:MAG: hypothetical protein PHI12_07505 [Dehalococcoidales bacterium]|nr:hypothetical protein [Dehalococcoidales bacterium]